jgi:hypothetical protein
MHQHHQNSSSSKQEGKAVLMLMLGITDSLEVVEAGTCSGGLPGSPAVAATARHLGVSGVNAAALEV